jgi:DNA topoisomerase-3
MFFDVFWCQTERKMVQVCEGTMTKHDMLHQGLNQYKEMFVIVRREFQRVTSVRMLYAHAAR